LYTDECEGDLI